MFLHRVRGRTHLEHGLIITALVPVVFLVLPVTILFAVWPGLSALKLTM